LQLMHAADIHVGARPYGLARLREHILQAFELLVEEALRERVDVLVVAGDLFDVPRPENEVLVKVISAFKRLTGKGVKVVLAHGDHDTPGRRDMTVLQLVAEAVDGVYAPWTDRIEDLARDLVVDIGGVRFGVLPFVRGREDRRKQFYLEYALPALRQAMASASGRRVFVGHLGLQEVFPFGPVASLSELPPADYYALGHIHRRHLFTETPGGGKGGYPGSLYPLNIDEAQHDYRRGAFLVDLTGDEPTIQEVPVEPAHHIYVEPIDLVEAAEKGAKPRDVLLRRFRSVLAKAPPGKDVVVWARIILGPANSPAEVENVLRLLRLPENVVIIPRYQWAGRGAEEKVEREVGEGLDHAEVLVRLYGVSREVAEQVIALKDLLAAEEPDEEAILGALDRLSRLGIDKVLEKKLGVK